MRVPLAWLRQFVDLPPDPREIAERLAMLGFPVDAIETRPNITGVVVAKIEQLDKHPNADRLQVARLNVGDERRLTVATAATNVAAGQTVALATIGARLPELTIAPRTMRGVASEGMMISAEELALPGAWFEDGILQLEADREPGSDAIAAFGLLDPVLEVEITSNRVDAMSIVGLARELAASYGVPLCAPEWRNPGVTTEPDGIAPRVSIESPDCRRFVAQRFDAIAIGPSPAWMRIRLALAGQRPIDNVVDVSNYVAIEIGQPLHFYDRERSGVDFVVRDARDGETLTTLDGVERPLTPRVLVIAGPRDAYGLAGLLGGQATEVRASTSTVVLEAASFEGARIRRAAKALGIRTEAATRHEKTLPPALGDAGGARAAQLLVQMGAVAYAPHAFGETPATAQAVVLTQHDVRRILGLDLSIERMAEHLTALGCAVAIEGASLRAVAPAWRTDLTQPADFIEEIARLEGYDAIEPAIASVAPHDVSSAVYDRERALAHALSGLHYREIVTYSLHGAGTFERRAKAGLTNAAQAIEVLDPLSEDQRYLRTTLLDGFVAYLASVHEPVRAFELGHVFARTDAEVTETSMLLFGATAPVVDGPAWRDDGFLSLKADVDALIRTMTGRHPQIVRTELDGLHPGKTAAVTLDGRTFGWFGRVDPRLTAAYDVRFATYACVLEIEALPDAVVPAYRAPSKFPGTYRDLALVVDRNLEAERLERTIAQTLGDLCRQVRVFDEYRGPQVPDGRKSLAVRAQLGRYDGTLTDDDADAAMARVLEVVRAELGADVRA